MRTVKDISELSKMYKIKIPKAEYGRKQENAGKLNKIRKMIKKIANEEIVPKPSTSSDCNEEIQEQVQELVFEELLTQDEETEIYPINLARAEYNRDEPTRS